MTTPAMRLVRPQWTRNDVEGWDVLSVDRDTYRYAETGRTVDVPIERGWTPERRAMIELYPEQLTWRYEDGSEIPVTQDEKALVVRRVSAGLELQGVLPVVRDA